MTKKYKLLLLSGLALATPAAFCSDLPIALQFSAVRGSGPNRTAQIIDELSGNLRDKPINLIIADRYKAIIKIDEEKKQTCLSFEVKINKKTETRNIFIASLHENLIKKLETEIEGQKKNKNNHNPITFIHSTNEPQQILKNLSHVNQFVYFDITQVEHVSTNRLNHSFFYAGAIFVGIATIWFLWNKSGRT